jgi:hypothetical protein
MAQKNANAPIHHVIIIMANAIVAVNYRNAPAKIVIVM